MKTKLVFMGVFFFTLSANAQWTKTNQSSASLYAFAFNATNLFTGAFDGVYSSTDNGINWVLKSQRSSNLINVKSLIINGINIFAGSSNGVFLSTDNGSNWVASNNGIPINSNIFSFAINGTNLFAGTSNDGVYLSTNNGANWTPVSNGLPANSWINSLAVYGGNIYAGTNTSGLYLSTNNGTNWISINNGLLTAQAIYSIVCSGNKIFAGTSNGVFLSEDNGSNWKLIFNKDIPNRLSSKGDSLFIGGTKGVYLLSKMDSNWITFNNGLSSNPYVRALAVIDNSIFVGVQNSGVWKYSLVEVGIDEFANTSNSIHVYPTITDSKITVELSLGIPQKGTFSVYSAIGQTYMKQNFTNSNLTIDISPLPNGCYILKIESDKGSIIKKVIKN